MAFTNKKFNIGTEEFTISDEAKAAELTLREKEIEAINRLVTRLGSMK